MNLSVASGAALLTLMMTNVATCQGILLDSAKRDAQAERYLIDYIEQSKFKSHSIAVIARCNVWYAGEPSVSDEIYGFIRDPENHFSYQAASVGSEALPAGIRFWTQHIELGEKRFARFGVGEKNDEFFDVQQWDTEKEPPDYVSNPRFLEPWSLPLTCRATLMTGRLTEDFATVTYLKNGRFIGSETDDEGRTVGVWQNFGERGAVVDVTFSKAKHHFPERVMIRRANGRHTLEDRSECPVFAITETKWKPLEMGDGSVRYFPHAIATVALQMGSRIPKYEMTVRFRWAVDSERKHRIPDPAVIKELFKTDYDWRKLLQERIADDWLLYFEEAIQQWDSQQ